MNRTVSISVLATSALLLGGCASMNSPSGDWKSLISPPSDTANVSQSGAGSEDRFGLGVYAAIGVGASRLEPDTSELPAWDPNDRVVPGGQVTLGADITRHFSIEGHSADLGSAGLSPRGRINYHINGVSALLYAGGNRNSYRRQGLTAFGRLGVGALDNTPVGDVPFVQDNATHILLGAGVEYMTPIGLGLRAEGISFDKDVRYAQLGMMYRFGIKNKVIRPKLAAAPKIVQPPIVAAAIPPPPPPAPVYRAPVRAPIIEPVYVAPVSAPNPCDALSGVLEGVDFRSDSAGITSVSGQVLNEVADILRNCKGVIVEVSAHTDNVGSHSYNQSLSEKRAQSVVDYLRSRGLNRNKLVAKAFGESKPIDTNDTADGRARNRRVELYAR